MQLITRTLNAPVQGSFSKKKCGKQTVGAPGLANGDEAPRRWGVGRVFHSILWEGIPPKKSILDLN